MVDPAHFRAVLGHFAGGVTVVAGIHEGRPAGFTCQSFFSLSLHPPLVALAPSKASTSWARVSGTGEICINILAAEQEALARSFARSGVDKFHGVRWSAGARGAPRIDDVLAWIDCSVEQVHDGGDHHLVVARVRALDTAPMAGPAAPGPPLVFYRGGFGSFTS